MKKPKISIVIPAHNEEEIIIESLNSVVSNKYSNKEIIVVNDGSTDRTKELVEKFSKKHKEVKLINFNEGHSAAFARNRGAENATGDILVFLDADTWINDIFLEEIAKKHFLGDGYSTLNHPSKKKLLPKILSGFLGPSDKLNLADGIVSDSPGFVRPMFFALSMKAYKKLKGYDEELFYYEDDDLASRFHDAGFKSVLVKNAVQFFELPADISGFFRQCKWIGIGINTIKDSELKKRLFKNWTLKFLFSVFPLFFLFNLEIFLILFFLSLMTIYLSLIRRNRNFLLSILALPFFYIKSVLVFFNLIIQRKVKSKNS